MPRGRVRRRWSAAARSAPRCSSRTIDGVFFTGSDATGRAHRRRRSARASSSCSSSSAARTRPTSATTPTRRPRPSRSPTARCTTPARAAARSSASTCTRRSTTPSSPPSSTTVKGFKVGDPMAEDTYIGAITRAPQLDVLDAQVADAKAKGATAAHRRQARSPGTGNWFEPTVFTDVDHRMQLMQEESFGPIIGIQKVKRRRRGAGADERHPLRPHRRRLHAGTRRARAKLLAQVNAGSVYWNCCDRVSPRLPWRGHGDSGVGLTLSTLRHPDLHAAEGLAPAQPLRAGCLFDLDGTLLDGDTRRALVRVPDGRGRAGPRRLRSAQPQRRRALSRRHDRRRPSSAPSTRRRSRAARRRPGPPSASASCRPGCCRASATPPGPWWRAIVTPASGWC